MLFPASEAVVAVINRLISESARPRHLPRLALAEGIPPRAPRDGRDPGHADRCRVAPTALAHRLLLHHLANPERTRPVRAADRLGRRRPAEQPGDAALLTRRAQQILRAQPAPPRRVCRRRPTPPRFILLHRERRFSETEQRWIGWERKRGKLEQLVAALAEGHERARSSTSAPSRASPPTRATSSRWTATPQLPPGPPARAGRRGRAPAQPAAPGRRRAPRRRRLRHPAAARRHAAAGAGDVTLYHWLFAGQCGIDPYSAASSEVYQDLFGEGTLHRQGPAQRAGAMHAVLVRPAAGGPGAQPRPARRLAGALRRRHRHHADRGRAVPRRRGRVARAPLDARRLAAAALPAAARGATRMRAHQPLEDVRQPAPLAGRADVAGAAAARAGRARLVVAVAALALVLAAFCGRAADGRGRRLCRPAATTSPSCTSTAQARSTWRARSGAALWQLAQLLQQALMAVDAVARALYRHGRQPPPPAAVDHRRRRAGRGRDRPSRPLRASTASTARWRWCCWPALLALRHAASGRWRSLLCLAWAASPVWTWWVSRPRAADAPTRAAARPTRLPGRRGARHLALLRALRRAPRTTTCRRTTCRRMPHDMVAHRTSPTNIGLYLLSAACARRFGWIGTPRADRPARGHAGARWAAAAPPRPLPELVRHPDLRTAAADVRVHRRQWQPQRPPARGRQACLELVPQATERTNGDDAAPASPGAPIASAWRWEPDFGFLYHRRRHLFHIGYRVAEQQLDASFYDLLASESRLTSLLAIAKGDVPVRHWAALGRPFYRRRRARRAALVVGLDVRVPDAQPGARRAARQRAARGLPAQRCASRSPSRTAQRRALGHLGIGLRGAATTRWPTSTRRRACRGWRCAARRPTSW